MADIYHIKVDGKDMGLHELTKKQRYDLDKLKGIELIKQPDDKKEKKWKLK